MAALDLRRWLVALLVGSLAAVQVAGGAPWFWPPGGDDPGGCLSWRVIVEANNAKFWRAVPAPCVGYVWACMSWGQYGRDVGSAADQIAAYASQSPAAGDGLDAWVLDIDNTCLSNLPYYQAKQFGSAGYRGQSSVVFKSAERRRLAAEGYRIRGNVGDQWSDLQGDCIFKVPNTMYFVP